MKQSELSFRGVILAYAALIILFLFASHICYLETL